MNDQSKVENKKIETLNIKNKLDYRTVFEELSEAILIIEENSIIDCNKLAVKLFGYASKKELLGLNIFELSPRIQLDGSYSKEKNIEIIQNVLKNGNHKFEWLHRTKKGKAFFAEVILTRIYIEDRNIISGVVKNVTEKKKQEKKINHLVFRDYLTGLYNRRFFSDHLSKLLRKDEKKENLAVLFMDLDGFKKINDNLGHENGDKILQIVADELKQVIDKYGTVARIGGDEFLILLPKNNNIEEVLNIGQKIIDLFKEPFIFDTHMFYIATSIGIAVYPSGGNDAETLIKNADIAMYKAKESPGSKIEFYSIDLNEKISDQFILENNLWFALDKKELFLEYQPIMDMNTEEIVAAEVLLRWRNDKLGFVPPDKFIPIAEENNLIIPIGQWILRSACEQNRRWQDMGLKPITVAVNISVKQLEQKDFLELVENILQETGLDPQYLELEITESISAKNMDEMTYMLKKLSDLGVKLSIDDFGTGYSSLGQLKKLFINKLKIDKSFVNDINEDMDNTAIVSTIIAMANTLNLQVIAEGIETSNQLNFLKENNCDMGQGYLFSRPIKGEMFEAMIKYEEAII